MAKQFATIVLAGGRGSRMGSIEHPKVCSEVNGKPAIVRALETYRKAGAGLQVVVVGASAEPVMRDVSASFCSVAFAFQRQQLGTGTRLASERNSLNVWVIAATSL